MHEANLSVIHTESLRNLIWLARNIERRKDGNPFWEPDFNDEGEPGQLMVMGLRAAGYESCTGEPVYSEVELSVYPINGEELIKTTVVNSTESDAIYLLRCLMDWLK